MSSAAAQLPTLAPVAVLTPLPTDHWRPATRGECEHGPRPCPYVGCRHHLYLEVRPESGELALTFPDLNPDELADTCALDVAERGGCGGLTLDEVGERLGVTRQRVQQVERKALLRAREAIRRLGLRAEQLLPDLETDDEQDQDGEREQGRDEQGERGGEDQTPEPRPSPTEVAGLRWFGEPVDEGEEAEAGRLFWDSLRPRAQADAEPRVFGKQEQEQEDTMQERDQTTSETDNDCDEGTPEHDPFPETQGLPAAEVKEQPLTVCPCGCGRPVRPGRAYASRGCSGRHRWAVAQTEGRSAPTPAPLALCPCGCGGEVAPGATYASRSCDRRAMQQRVAELEERNEELRLQLATVREETARRCEQEAAALTARLEQVESENARLLASLHEEQRRRAKIAHALDLSEKASLDEVLARVSRLLEGQESCLQFIVDRETTALRGRIAELEAQGRAMVLDISDRDHRRYAVCEALGLPEFSEQDATLDRIKELLKAEADRRALAAALEMSETMSLDGLTGKIGYLMRASGTLGVLRVKGIIDDDSNPLASASLPRPEALPTGYAFEVAEYVSDLAERLMGQKP